MSTLTRLKTAHIEAADKQWEDAVRRVREYLVHDDPDVRALTRRIFTVSGSTRWAVFGGMESGFAIQLDSYGFDLPLDACALMNFAAHFVGYYLLKHCEPGIAYYRYAHDEGDPPSETFLLCNKDHPGARPYFHRNHELLVQTVPDAERLTVKRALEVLDWHEQDREDSMREMQAEMEAHGEDCIWDADDLASYDLTPQDKAFATLADEIIALEG